LWTVRMRNDEIGQSLVLNRTERLDQPSAPASDVRLVFQRAGGDGGAEGVCV